MARDARTNIPAPNAAPASHSPFRRPSARTASSTASVRTQARSASGNRTRPYHHSGVPSPALSTTSGARPVCPAASRPASAASAASAPAAASADSSSVLIAAVVVRCA